MPFEFGTGVATARLIGEAAKKLQDLTKSSDVELDKVRIEVSAMRDHVFTMQQALSDGDEEIRSLRRQLDERHEVKQKEADLRFVEDGSYYVRETEREKGVLNALCPVCFGTGKFISMLKLSNGAFRCAIHKVMHETSASRAKDARDLAESYNDMQPRGGPWS